MCSLRNLARIESFLRTMIGNSGPILLCLVGCLVVAAPGCSPPKQIHSYTVPKMHERMLAGMTIHGDKAWFFKILGPSDLVDEKADDFRALVESVEFDSDGQPSWSLPEGWTDELSKERTRHATIKTGDRPGAIQASVVLLQAPSGDKRQYELANVNRWRNQLGLPPVTDEELNDHVERLTLAHGPAVWLDATGTGAPGSSRSAPFMAGNRPHPPVDTEDAQTRGEKGVAPSARGNGVGSTNGNAGASARPPSTSPLIQVTAPETWTKGRLNPMRKAAFVVGEADATADITVIDLAAAHGKLLDNVNRWRGQVGLDAIDQSTLDETLIEIPVGNVTGKYVEIFNPNHDDLPRAILGVIAVRKDRAWFFKLTGPVPLAKAEKERFLEFVKSSKFAE